MSEPVDFLGLGLGRGVNDPAEGFGTGRDSCEGWGNVDIEAMATLFLLTREMYLIGISERDGHTGRSTRFSLYHLFSKLAR